MASERPPSIVLIQDFPGMIDFGRLRTEDIPQGGADIQVNCASFKKGELQVRGGVRQVTFEN